MLDVRTGIALESSINDTFVEVCGRHKISKGDFIAAILTQLDPAVTEAALLAFKKDKEAKRAERKEAKKGVNKLLKSLKPEEIQAILAAREQA